MSIEILLIEMIKRISIAAVLGLLLAQTKLVDRLMTHRMTFRDRILFVIFFSFVAISGTYGGIPIHDALANSRVVGIIAAGLLGGPVLGTTVGVIAGIHRLFLGGFTAVACGTSSAIAGLLSGIFTRIYPHNPIPWYIAFAVGFVCESFQMIIILAMAKPFEEALTLVSQIAIPMILANSCGTALFTMIINDAFRRKESIAANQSHIVLLIARQTSRFLRQGLTPETAKQVVKIIKEHTNYDAVSITDTKKALAFQGVGADHHSPNHSKQLTALTRTTLETGEIHLALDHRSIGCEEPGCRLHNAVIVPLKQASTIVGTLKLYYTAENHQVSKADIAFAQGLGDLFSTQLELNEIDRQAKLTEEEKLKALQVQINPHFLFNTLNTISSLIRTNPTLARRLLIKFSHLFRFTLQYTGKTISFEQEWAQARAFLEIAEARQGDKLEVITNINPNVMHYSLPSLTLQPIIENAIKHGLQPREEGGTLSIVADEKDNEWFITVTDDGVGFDKDPEEVLNKPRDGHIGLSNVHQRMQSLYEKEYGLRITSNPEEGTRVCLRIPKTTETGESL